MERKPQRVVRTDAARTRTHMHERRRRCTDVNILCTDAHAYERTRTHMHGRRCRCTQARTNANLRAFFAWAGESFRRVLDGRSKTFWMSETRSTHSSDTLRCHSRAGFQGGSQLCSVYQECKETKINCHCNLQNVTGREQVFE